MFRKLFGRKDKKNQDETSLKEEKLNKKDLLNDKDGGPGQDSEFNEQSNSDHDQDVEPIKEEEALEDLSIEGSLEEDLFKAQPDPEASSSQISQDHTEVLKDESNLEVENLYTDESQDSKDEDQAESSENPEEDFKKEKKGLFSSFFEGLTKTRENISRQIDSVLRGGKIDEEMYESLEDILIMADIGADTTLEVVDRLRSRVKEKKISDPTELKGELNSVLKDYMEEDQLDNKIDTSQTPKIILVVGVNGVGKTTSIGKMAKRFKDQGKTVLLSAADTFRAAAVEQLGEWATRVGVEMVAGSENADPGSVVYDSISSAKSRNIDILIVDTAGRLHNKKNLMNELNKIYRIIEKEYPEASLETLIALDATTGQNAMNQAKEFSEVANISGVILTKMDGTAKGGVVIRIQSELKIPVKLIGLGESVEDLKVFDVDSFIDSIIS